MTPKHAIAFVVSAVMAVGVSYYGYNFLGAEERVRRLCSQIQPDMPVARLREFASAHGLSPLPPDSGVGYIVESKTFGRFGCKVLLEGGVVKEAEYNFAG